MVGVLPAIEYDAPAVNPAGLGLYDAATLIDQGGPSRHFGGVRIRPRNCGTGVGTWDSDICADPTPDKLKTGSRSEAPAPFEPLTIWTYDECDPGEGATEVEARATQLMRLNESLLVESQFGQRLLADAPPAASFVDIVSAVGALEEALGETGFLGTIHASRRFAAQAQSKGLILRSGALLKTPLGHTWAFGGGYGSSLGNTLVATGPVTIWRDALTTRSALDHRANIIAGIAERSVVVGYECFAESVTIGESTSDSSLPGLLTPGSATPGS